MDVAVVTVGDELLAGETINTNGAWLGKQLTDAGASVERLIAVPDRVADIARVVNEFRAEYDAVVVTGGVGPTHDDVTMEGVAAAFGTSLAPDEEVSAWLATEGYAGEDLAPKTTHIPERASLLENPAGVAPGCVLDSVYVLPGVPSEMKAMFETIRDTFSGTERFDASVVTSESESQLLDRIKTARERFDVEIGSYPSDDVTLKIRGTDREAVASAAEWLREQVDLVE